ncbi:MAG TPA: radical SAM/SPASM domain-containing protein [Candidatus Omnitrophota bacterium]|nr:radical SAM/SPASM domain-containing protein [Candidatus Omnitrophota bacterium]
MGRGPTEAYYRSLNKNYVKGTLTCLKSSTIKNRLSTDFPLVLNIEPTNRCNLKCFYCPRQKAHKGIGDMQWGLYQRIIDEAADKPKLIMLNLHKDGESFLHPKFFDMIRYAKKKNVAETIHVNTNALSLTSNRIDRLLDSGIDDITISIDAARPQTYKRHKGADLLAQVEHNVGNLFQRKHQRRLQRPFVRVKIMEFEGIEKEEIREFFVKWRTVADMVQVTGIHSWSGAINGIRVTDEQTQKRYPCAIMWYALVINWNGQATVCSVDWNTEINVGDANTTTIHDIWNSAAIKKARLLQLRGKYQTHHVCKKCVVWVSVGDLKNWLIKKKEFYS